MVSRGNSLGLCLAASATKRAFWYSFSFSW